MLHFITAFSRDSFINLLPLSAVMPRIAIVHKERCNPQGCGGYLCIRVCPVNRAGKECIVVDPKDKKIMINEELATSGCAICQNACPFGAIEMINLPEALKQAMHRYGKNGFALYSLPNPVFGKVVGIIGRNGIGKSTAIRILAGVQKPNFGKDAEGTFEQLLHFFKGSESQRFFEGVANGSIKVSYKPQQIDLSPNSVNGTVKELLRRADEKGHFLRAVEALELADIIDNDIATLSGGELQRVAVAAAALKKANFYVFDEPTSYLDVKQRVKVAGFIKSLAEEKTSVMVAEHDLVVLDFLADVVQIVYGKEGAYGIASIVKPGREGINTYLEGFIREENMRFRNFRIKFEAAAPLKTKVGDAVVEWNGIVKQLGNFVLSAESGSLHKGSVVGVVGENGTGKTTFVRMLAQELKTDYGGVNTKLSAAYKPQYLKAEQGVLVSSVLADAVKHFEPLLIGGLELQGLMNLTLDQLSGGELQRVAIANCLSRHAELFLLDEPSAYLDVEQRLAVSKVIRDFASQTEKTVLVVDHDISFLSYFVQQLMVFAGIPAKEGKAYGPMNVEEGMNMFLKSLNISMRRDHDSLRPRINKPDSRMDREQKEQGRLFYT